MHITLTDADKDDLAKRLWEVARKDLLSNGASDATWGLMQAKVKQFADMYWTQCNIQLDVLALLKEYVRATAPAGIESVVRGELESIFRADPGLRAAVRASLIEHSRAMLSKLEREDDDDESWRTA